MSANTTNILIVGVGGQGTLLASRVLAQAAMDLGHDVKVSEIHGMAQRGGSVVSQVRYGPQVFSPIIKMGEADVIMAFEKLEAARYLSYLRKDGLIVINTESIDPLPVMSGADVYPENLEQKIAAVVPNTVIMDASGIAEECGNIKAANIVMVGRVGKALQMSKDSLAQAIKTLVPSKAIDINLRALDAGWDFMD
ncbi:MAG: indolepyruvate oxidoreductase subunit beta [Syntrophomonadaceae bacterium]|nr:indolepyruvate oxidoreductase subunit beta [Syntrophomonadaceae bacterium]